MPSWILEVAPWAIIVVTFILQHRNFKQEMDRFNFWLSGSFSAIDRKDACILKLKARAIKRQAYIQELRREIKHFRTSYGLPAEAPKERKR